MNNNSGSSQALTTPFFLPTLLFFCIWSEYGRTVGIAFHSFICISNVMILAVVVVAAAATTAWLHFKKKIHIHINCRYTTFWWWYGACLCNAYSLQLKCKALFADQPADIQQYELTAKKKNCQLKMLSTLLLFC